MENHVEQGLRVLCHDRDPATAVQLAGYLNSLSFRTRVAASASAALALAAQCDLVVADWQTEECAGWEFARELSRHNPQLALVFRQTQWDPEERLRALGEYCDECLNKDCELTELLARIRCLGRRVCSQRRFGQGRLGQLEIDLIGGGARIHGREIALQPLQLRILALLFQAAGAPVSREELRTRVFKAAQLPGSTNIDRQISALRAQLGNFRPLIATVRGGYRLDALAARQGRVGAELSSSALTWSF